jgi:hypothetical protein
MDEDVEFRRWKKGIMVRLKWAIGIIVLAPIVAILAVIGLTRFDATGRSFLHPYLALFLIFGSIAIFAVAINSLLHGIECLSEGCDRDIPDEEG